jgi:hypothetical protein
MEGGRETIVGLLESDDLESPNIIHAMKLARGTSAESSAPDSDFAHLLDDMSEDILNGSGQPMACGFGYISPLTSMAPSGAPGNSKAHLIWNPYAADNCAKTTIAQIFPFASRA